VVPVSFLRVNKPDWGLEVIRHDAVPLAPEETDAVEDSRLVLELLAIEHRGALLRSRRELLLRAMRRITEGLALTGDERSTLHREGYAWAVELGRWDATGLAALQARFVAQRDGMTELLRTPCDAASEKRWASIARAPGPPQAAIERARQAIRHHANRLGVFAEAEAILHYFLFRLETEDIP
jgi:hypothetical protein